MRLKSCEVVQKIMQVLFVREINSMLVMLVDIAVWALA